MRATSVIVILLPLETAVRSARVTTTRRNPGSEGARAGHQTAVLLAVRDRLVQLQGGVV